MPSSIRLLLALLLAALPVRADLKERLERELVPLVQADLLRLNVPGLVALVVQDGEVVWARGFGMADRERSVPSSPDTVYRVGSISKLFTAVAVMQLVEAGRLDLDAPVTTWLPGQVYLGADGAPGPPVTLRLLLSHRAGIPRECRVGSYFDGTEPGLEATVASHAGVLLVQPPGTRTKYSNVGPSIAGLIVERVAGVPFASYQQERILRLLGMETASFRLGPRQRERLAQGYMRDVYGRRWPAPVFELGTLPAGNLYASARDLGRFLAWVLQAGPPLLKAESLAEMGRRQAGPGEGGYGLGFHLGREPGRGRKTLGHNGAVYGHSSAFLAIPEMRAGVVVLNNLDCAAGLNDKVARFVVQLLNEETGPAAPDPACGMWQAGEASPAEIAALAGAYVSEKDRIELRASPAGLVLLAGGVLTELAHFPTGGVVTHGLMGFGETLIAAPRGEGGPGLLFRGRLYRPAPPEPEPEPPAGWARLVGSYGPDHIPMEIFVRRGRLTARVEWLFEYPLEPAGGLCFRFPSYGLYAGEGIVFLEKQGEIAGASMALVPLARRP